MDKSILVGIISFVTVFVSFILALFLLTVKTNNKLPNKLFAAFVILSAIDISGFFSYYFLQEHLNWEMLRSNSSLLIMPAFYLYVLAACYADFKLRPKHLLHAIPFLVANVLVAKSLYLADDATKTWFFENYMSRPENIALRILNDLQFIGYIVAIFLTLKKYREIYQENYTDPAVVTYKWLFQFAMVSVVAHSIVTIKNILIYTSTEVSIWASLLVGVIALGVLCWFVLKALYHPELFRGVNSKLELVKNMLPANKNHTAEQEIKTKIEELKAFMDREEPFLEPSLTVQDLADQLKMPAKELSILINHYQDQHFFDFVNEYRIQKAMQLLKDPSKRDLNVQEVLYAVGFNSKSSFNTAFKKYTGKTPTQYRTS